jgi:excisionase family DNA binding protein
MYSCEEIAERYGVKNITVWDWIRKKKLSAIKIGKGYRISENDLETFENERRTIK